MEEGGVYLDLTLRRDFSSSLSDQHNKVVQQ